jgi:LPXTG-motif cell wall-anchored protein
MTIIITVVLLMTSISFAHQGDNDNYKGHFVKKDNVCVAYHYNDGFLKGWELTFNKRIEWNEREKLIKPFKINNTLLGKWTFYKDCNFPKDYTVIPKPSVSPSISPSVSPSIITSISPSIIPTGTPQPNSTNTLPKTGQSENVLYIAGGIIAVLGIMTLVIKNVVKNEN